MMVARRAPGPAYANCGERGDHTSHQPDVSGDGAEKHRHRLACDGVGFSATALAVRMADAAGITLAAIARADGFEVFTHPCRISSVAVAGTLPPKVAGMPSNT